MKTYKILYDFENYYSFTIKGTELYSKMPAYSPRFDAKSRQQEWVVPNASFYATSNYASDKVAIPAITTWVTGNLVLNGNAYACLAAEIEKSGEFLAVSVEGIDYYIFNTLKVIDEAFIDKTAAMEIVEGGINAGLENVAFTAEGLEGDLLFKSPSDHLLHTYCTETFKNMLHENQLDGLWFEEMIVRK